MSSQSDKNTYAIYLSIGVVLGILFGRLTNLALLNQQILCENVPYMDSNITQTVSNYDKTNITNYEESQNNLVLIGVLTAQKYINSRAVAAYETWVKDIPGKVIFYSSKQTNAPKNIEVVSLDVDDSYPPQKKSFMMLQHMYQNYGNDYQFFMRADDDIYIRGDFLKQFLKSINAQHQSLYIGQAGLGNKQEFGALYLNNSENFCMGGPGIIITAPTLAIIAEHAKDCLGNLYTHHEDVELGRCIHRHANVSCTWAYEMQSLMYNNYKEDSSPDPSLHLHETSNAITLHPFKQPHLLYKTHAFFLNKRVSEIKNHIAALELHLKEINEILGINDSKDETEVVDDDVDDAWDMLDSRHIYPLHNPNPRQALPSHLISAINSTTQQLIKLFNGDYKRKGRYFELRDVLYGYHRGNFMNGHEFILDLLLQHSSLQTHKSTLVRRYVRVRRAFLPPEISIESHTNSALQRRVNWVVAVWNKLSAFHTFIHNFKQNFLDTADNVSLTVMLFVNQSQQADLDSEATVNSTIHHLTKLHPHSPMRVVVLRDGFNRGSALQKAASSFAPDDLLFFVDVDVYVARDVMRRVRLNTAYNKQVYYPIVFSQYNPEYSCLYNASKSKSHSFNSQNPTCPVNDLKSSAGYWRSFGFGIASMFKADLDSVGGFNLDIKGWGKEDVDLVDRFISSHINVMRAVDPGLTHIYHPIICDPRLDSAQYKMCLGTLVSNFASGDVLSELLQHFHNFDQ